MGLASQGQLSPCDVAARAREAGDEPARNRIPGTSEYDRDRLGRLLRGLRGECG